ncbi:hypothetical protein GY45DRAFT_1262880 [Cubamyces sp. BRFM 1775]|nr:hypothetical protein GY45DRAFT_1262880 [Cubamyces sp. BRFM 1775]
MPYRTPYLLVDMQDRVVGVLAGHPDSPDWRAVVEEAQNAMEDALRTCNVRGGPDVHRRGAFTTLACGVSFGGGQTEPMSMLNKPMFAEITATLRQNPAIQRLAGFGSSILRTYAPRIFGRMQRTLDALYKRLPWLVKNFAKSVYPAISFNLGPETVCLPHADSANDPFNFCHITALGRYNPKTSTHFVLLRSKLIVEFPPGASILMMSAIEPHANTPLQPGETRQSLTQYCAGGLLRWVDAGFQTLTEFAKADPVGKAAFDARAGIRVKEFLGLFSTYTELLVAPQQ